MTTMTNSDPAAPATGLQTTHALNLVREELTKARHKHRAMASHHEAYGIIQEEVDEFWDEVKKKEENRDRGHTREELVQIAAMACRAIIDLDLL